MKLDYKNYSPLIAILLGLIGYRWLAPLAGTIPYTIVGMLFFTFLSFDFKKLSLSRSLLMIYLGQILMGLLSYILLKPIDSTIAVATMMCIITPAATASTTLTRLMGGDESLSASYIVISHVGITLLAPFVFGLLGERHRVDFSLSLDILSRLIPMIVIPIASGYVVQQLVPQRWVHASLPKKKIPFILWVVSACLIIAQMAKELTQDGGSYALILLLSGIALLLALLQFFLGAYLGRHLRGSSPVALRQALGQKNTALGIFLVITYIDAVSAIALAAYIVWQNIINSIYLTQYNVTQKKL